MRDTIPKMSRQDFEFIADTINSWTPPAILGGTWAESVVTGFRSSLAEHFVARLVHTNPAFKESRFIERATR